MSRKTQVTGFDPEERDEAWLRMWIAAQKPTPPDIAKVISAAHGETMKSGDVILSADVLTQFFEKSALAGRRRKGRK